MCGQFMPLDYDRFEETARELATNRVSPENYSFRETVYPSQSLDAITAERVHEKLVFGIKLSGSGQVINAREERIRESSMFSSLIKNNRCVIPAECYFEWLKIGNKRYKYRISGYGGEPLLLAGLHGRGQCVIITREAEEGISFIHPRMPRILTLPEAREWLGTGYGELIGAMSDIKLIPQRVQ